MLENQWHHLALVAIVAFTPQLVRAAEPVAPADSQVVNGTRIYVGVMPAAMILGHARGHPETSMHDGIPPDDSAYHVLIALFDSQSGRRIVDAKVQAAVAEPGLPGETKRLETMTIAGTQTYGNYFRMSGPGPFNIQVTVLRPGGRPQIQARFQHRHY